MITSYKNLSIAQYEQISKIMSSSLSDAEKDLRILSVLTSIDVDSIRNLSVSKINDLLSKASFLSTPPILPSLRSFRYQGFKFAVPSPTDITMAQYMDLSSSSTLVDQLHSLLVPKGHQYNDGYRVDFSSLPSDLALSFIQSFTKVSAASVKHSLRSSLLGLLLRRRISLREAMTGLKKLSSISA